MWRCPACGCWSERAPAHCDGCEWTDRAGAQQARQRLSKINRSGTPLAFLCSGCRVCRECRKQFRKDARRCPLHLFYLGLREWAFSRQIESPVLAQTTARTLFDQLLAERGYPEEVEGYWRRMLPWLSGVRGRR